MSTRLAYLCPEMGAVNNTFIYREIETLRGKGCVVMLFSTTYPEDKAHTEDPQWLNETVYLYRASRAGMFSSALHIARTRLKAFVSSLSVMFSDMIKGSSGPPLERLKLPWHFLAGCYLARQLMLQNIQHLHIHFAHTPTSVGMYGAMMAGIPYSFMGHANDLFQRAALLKEKVRRSAFSACISYHNKQWLCERGCDESKLHIVRCGIDTTQYSFR
ncbi:MAG: glycosyltransferase family 4 protein, partial [Candidatus Hydrogenedentota bacterium]